MRGLSKIVSGGILMTVSYFQECAMFVCIVMDYYKLGESSCIQNKYFKFNKLFLSYNKFCD